MDLTIILAASALNTSLLVLLSLWVFSRKPVDAHEVAKFLVVEGAAQREVERIAEQARLSALAQNPFVKSEYDWPGNATKVGGWNLTEQGRLLVEDYAHAAMLADAANVKIPPFPVERALIVSDWIPDMARDRPEPALQEAA